MFVPHVIVYGVKMTVITITPDMETEMQRSDRVSSVQASATYTYRVGYATPKIAMWSPEIIYNYATSLTSAVSGFDGEWAASVSPETARARLTYQVSSFGKGVPKVPVTLMDSNYNVLETKETDENGLVDFSLEFNSPGSYVYYAVIGEGKVKPLTLMSPRVTRTFIKVWLVKVQQINSTDVWLRWVGRAMLEPLPHDFWRVHPRTIVGLAIPKLSRAYHMLVPVVLGINLNLELGVSAACNTPTAYPPSDTCCQYAKGTWWTYKLYYKSSVKSDWVESGGDKINVDYHLKYVVTTDGISYKGRCLKPMPNGKVRCSWESGTAPQC